MNKIFFLSAIAVVFLLTSCAVQHKSLSGISQWSYPQHQMDSVISFSFVDDVLDKSGNKRQAKWADRKGIEIISIKLINNTKKPIHGTQIAYLLNNKKPEIIHNKWLAKKVRQRISPLMILALPFFIVEALLFHQDDNDNDYYQLNNIEPYYITNEVVAQQEVKRGAANFNLQKEIMSFKLASQVLVPGRPVYGIIGIKTGQKLDNLEVVVKQTDSALF